MKTQKKKLTIAVNGLGRIGRIFLRLAWDNPLFNIVAANSRSDLEGYAHLLKYDSVYGMWNKTVVVKGSKLLINDKALTFYQEKDASGLPWKSIKPDLVVEASGKYRDLKGAEEHIRAGAKYVLITAPVDGPGQVLVYGVNHKQFDSKQHEIISAASCTSVCSALTLKVLEERFGIESGFLTTIHAITSDQKLQDSSHKDLRRARAASHSIIPTSSGVVKTIDKIFPKLAKHLDGMSYRVPVVVPSVLNATLQLRKEVTVEAINSVFEKASKGVLKGLLDVNNLPLVSADYIGNPHGATIDMLSTKVVRGKTVNIVAWYDNEWGYVSQVVKLIEALKKEISK
jgi:glyceraldehyde 3-phosphate dehydrogenase